MEIKPILNFEKHWIFPVTEVILLQMYLGCIKLLLLQIKHFLLLLLHNKSIQLSKRQNGFYCEAITSNAMYVSPTPFTAPWFCVENYSHHEIRSSLFTAWWKRDDWLLWLKKCEAEQQHTQQLHFWQRSAAPTTLGLVSLKNTLSPQYLEQSRAASMVFTVVITVKGVSFYMRLL